MNRKSEIDDLIQQYADGLATESDIDRLNDLLLHDSETRKLFVEYLNLDAALAANLADAIQPKSNPEPIAANGTAVTLPTNQYSAPKWSLLSRWSIAIAVSIIMLILAWFWWNPGPAAEFAAVSRSFGVVELPEGTKLRDQWIEINAGTVELVTSRDARVVIEAPAKFRFESAQRLHLDFGRLAADVPEQAANFTVVTPNGEAVDLGTKFGVDVARQGKTEIHVFQGEVVAKTDQLERPQNLKTGEAFILHPEGGVERSLRSGAFIHSKEVSEFQPDLVSSIARRSEEILNKLRQDPTMILLLDFESDELPDGNYRMVQGRWPGTRAPEFVRKGDHIKLNIGSGQQWDQLTLAAWVRLDRLGSEPYQSLLHTNGWGKNPGQVHWMVTQLNTMRLALWGNRLAPGSDEKHFYPDSRTSVLPEQGRWVHLATVYDASAGTVRFYLNGKFDKQTRQSVAHPARLGPSQIGNWNHKDRKLSGRIDELILLGRAMNDNELRMLFEAGNPYR